MKPIQALEISKKGQVNSIAPAIIILVLAGAILIMGIIMLQALRDSDVTGGTTTEAFDGANKTLVGLGTFGDFWEIIVLAIIISIVIGLLLTVFGTSRQR